MHVYAGLCACVCVACFSLNAHWAGKEVSVELKDEIETMGLVCSIVWQVWMCVCVWQARHQALGYIFIIRVCVCV
jgi:hypothetical protein